MVYQNNLFEALDRYAPDIERYMLTGNALIRDSGKDTVDDSNKSTLSRKNYGKIIQSLNHLLYYATGKNFLLHHIYHKSVDGGLDVTFNLPATYRRNFIYGKSIASLFWIPDFQHIHYPEFFSYKEKKMRDVYYKQLSKQATLIVLSSRDAMSDFKRFAPEFIHKARVMNFVSYVPPDIYDHDPAQVVSKYNIPSEFFYMPNQFWVHKNHEVVFKALKILKDKGIDVNIVCTGIQNDRRNPSYFKELMSKVDAWGIGEHIYLLNIIPREDVYLLYRQAICVINPSLFEGWSTSVEESKSIGKMILLSDIRVHHEQNPFKGIYFDPKDAESLAEKMEKIWFEKGPGPDLEFENIAKKNLYIRMQRYANTFSNIATEAIEIANGIKKY